MAKILIVDDEKLICEEFSSILSEEGHQVDMAFNGIEAIEKVKAAAYDIVFLDVLMPRMEGREAFDKIRAVSQVPVVIMSGYLPQHKEREVIALGALACLRKPLDLSKVRSLIHSVAAKKGG